MTQSVVTEELDAGAGLKIGHAELNVATTLNSLSLEMVRALTQQLNAWQDREDLAAVLITGAGDRAFCAGGDIQALYHAITRNHQAQAVVDSYPFDFFAEEYRLDYAIHTYPKPVLTIGHGVVMGGGLGIFSASSHRVATETSRLAVPEITIGLFPDAGATWSLGRMPQHWASFLGMTDSHINAADALATGLATHCVSQAERQQMIADLQTLSWQANAADNHLLLDAYLAGQVVPELPASELDKVPARSVHVDDFAREVAALKSLAGASKWVDRGLGNLTNGCPTTAGIVLEQLRRVGELSLADSFRLELTVATHCANNTDFREGVRALLIEKDNAPAWKFGNLDGLQWDHVLSHFEAPWDVHPLADLGGDNERRTA
ncbi:MAG: enoyl-CoA hydratase/isomerase family protein [Pseudomonadales bacterium]